MRWAMLVFALSATGGCVTNQPPLTASGHPEHTLTDVDVACVRGQLMSFVVNRGFAVRQSNENQIVAGKITGNFAAAVLLSSRAFGPPEERIMLTMIPLGENSVRVLLYGGYVTNPGTAFEQVTPVAGTASDNVALGNTLNGIAAVCPTKKAANSSGSGLSRAGSLK